MICDVTPETCECAARSCFSRTRNNVIIYIVVCLSLSLSVCVCVCVRVCVCVSTCKAHARIAKIPPALAAPGPISSVPCMRFAPTPLLPLPNPQAFDFG